MKQHYLLGDLCTFIEKVNKVRNAVPLYLYEKLSIKLKIEFLFYFARLLAKRLRQSRKLAVVCYDAH